MARFEELDIRAVEGRERLIAAVATQVHIEFFGHTSLGPQDSVILQLVADLFDYDNLFVLPTFDWDADHAIADLWSLREELTRQEGLIDKLERVLELVELVATGTLLPIYNACPTLLEQDVGSDGIVVPTELLRSIGDTGSVLDQIIAVGLADGLAEADLFPQLQGQLRHNQIVASGGNPEDPASFKRAPKKPSQHDAKTPEELITAYLGSTPLAVPFDQTLNFIIPTKSRFEHHHIVAGSGHGKTQTLQYLIAQDLAAMEYEKRSIIVLDSQGDLIRNIKQLAVFGPEGPLHDKLVVIDPTDVEYPVSLNLFDVGQERLAGYAPLERERMTNSILELYDFVLGTLLDAQMTQKQSVIFRYVTRLMLHIPDATIHTLRELMEPDSEKKFAADIDKLEGTARHFFKTEFTGREFEQTKKQVLRRLWGILENQTFERMFSHPRSKLDLFSEMNADKVILINTAKDLLKETGTEIFGRFFIAMIAQAAQERATLKGDARVPTMVYVDEAQDYFDRNIGIILAQARKYNVGMVLAHQYLGQLEPKLQEAFAANTAIKFAGGVSAKDARSLAPMLYTDPAFIEAQGKGSFAAHIRGVTQNALPLAFPFGHMEALPVMPAEERDALGNVMRARYAVHHSQIGKVGEEEAKDAEGEAGAEEKSETQPKKPASKRVGSRPAASNKPAPDKPMGSASSTVSGSDAEWSVQGSDDDDNDKTQRKRGDVDTDPSDSW